ncbi:preprotein translocase subunit SecA [Aestuariivirga litoralis]|uniref:preprotein translocase subunit SecA n=1 Tax=Aestuariivirga litoralis TaxID=2650924 RepID=UPI0018C7FDB6|nr:preprotein translocase subunit SecA [Aestuariivirga litoralis]MBG1233350.1 preprotein translocase subunit SecA [Aestuariivirga litoralis]
MLGLGTLAAKVFGTTNGRKLVTYQKKVPAINAMEPEYEALSDSELMGLTAKFRAELAEGKTLDDLLVPAFAAVREAAKRSLGLRHFDVQMVGGMVLNAGMIAEMKTGEGKTLVSTLPVYLAALAGKGVHVVTVNDYLAKRDSAWMGKVFATLGMTTGVIVHGLDDNQRRAAYACDVTYGTNNELGFDYLRDNMKYHLEEMVQREHNFAIVDEVDSILIDEARTPLIISGPVDDKSDLYNTLDKFIPQLLAEDFELDEKQRQVTLTEAGNEHLEQMLLAAGVIKGGTLYDAANVTVVHHIQNALRAHKLFTLDKDYIVKDGEVVIIDEFTGRMMPGRRYSEGLHQAIEAKEHVQVQPENVTMASITFQNYFRMYDKLAGMTGTALTEVDEFIDIYGLDVLEVPTNVPVARLDESDEVYRTEREKFTSIIETIRVATAGGQPVLVGTASIEKSEQLSAALTAAKIQHNVLNARFHEQEAQIIAQAGAPGAVTIATNMAGRGTDIKLGGNLDMRVEQELAHLPEGPERNRAIQKIVDEIESNKRIVLDAGGLFVIGTERHESRRIDNQLRGRSGRQGDPGRSRFYLSLQDDLMRIFGTDRLDGMLQKLGLKEGEAIVSTWINKALETAQKKVEARNFDIRKNLLKFDNVMNDQRKVIFDQRVSIMKGEEVSETVDDMRHDVVSELVSKHIPENAYAESWDAVGLREKLRDAVAIDFPVDDWAKEEGIAEEQIRERVLETVDGMYIAKREEWNQAMPGQNLPHQIEKSVLLQTLDKLWREHIIANDYLRQVIHLRGYGQRDPLNEYKTEGYNMFQDMVSNLKEAVTSQLMRVQLQSQPPDGLPDETPLPPMEMHHIDATSHQDEGGDQNVVVGQMTMEAAAPAKKKAALKKAAAKFNPKKPETWGKVARNDDCPCGSGKKYKHCHGAFV